MHWTLYRHYCLALRKELMAKVYVAVSMLCYRTPFVRIGVITSDMNIYMSHSDLVQNAPNNPGLLCGFSTYIAFSKPVSVFCSDFGPVLCIVYRYSFIVYSCFLYCIQLLFVSYATTIVWSLSLYCIQLLFLLYTAALFIAYSYSLYCIQLLFVLYAATTVCSCSLYCIQLLFLLHAATLCTVYSCSLSCLQLHLYAAAHYVAYSYSFYCIQLLFVLYATTSVCSCSLYCIQLLFLLYTAALCIVHRHF
jgi:hypothetical protein